MSDPEPTAPLPAAATRGSPLVPLFLTVLVDVMGLTIMIPILPRIATSYGASAIVATSLFACYSACQFIAGPILGRVSDRVGRKPTLLVSQLGTFASLVLLATVHRLELLFVARIIDGLTAGNLSIAQAYITDVTKPENRTRAFGLIGLAFGIGFTIAPALAGKLAELYGTQSPMFMAAGFSALSVILTALLLPNLPPKGGEAPSRTELFKRYMGKGPTRGRLLEMFAFTWSFSTLTSGFALVMAARFHYEVSETGYLFAYIGVIGGVVQGGLGRASKTLGDAKLSIAGLVFMVAGYLILSSATTLATLLIALGVGAIGSAVARPALTTLLTKAVPPAEHGLTLGINQSLSAVALMGAPLVGGFLIGRDAFAAWALVAALFASIAIGIRVILPPGPSPSEKETRGPQAV